MYSRYVTAWMGENRYVAIWRGRKYDTDECINMSVSDDYIIEINKRLEGKTPKEQLAELNKMIDENSEKIKACHDAMLRQ